MAVRGNIYTLGLCDLQEKHPHSDNVAIHTGGNRLKQNSRQAWRL